MERVDGRSLRSFRTRHTILDAARDLLSVQRDFTAKEIAELAGVCRATFYVYFNSTKDLENIIIDVVKRDISLEEIHEKPSTHSEARRNAALTLLDYFGANPGLARNYLAKITEKPETDFITPFFNATLEQNEESDFRGLAITHTILLNSLFKAEKGATDHKNVLGVIEAIASVEGTEPFEEFEPEESEIIEEELSLSEPPQEIRATETVGLTEVSRPKHRNEILYEQVWELVNEEFKHKDIAERLGISAGNARVIAYRLRKEGRLLTREEKRMRLDTNVKELALQRIPASQIAEVLQRPKRVIWESLTRLRKTGEISPKRVYGPRHSKDGAG